MKFCNVALTMAALIYSWVVPLASAAEEHLVTQKDLKFNPIIKVVKPGDSVQFKNSDNVVHNIVSLTDEFEFNLGEFKPGMTKIVKFKEKGVVDVECTIHPEMKMTIFVF
jgi:plastocyanin